MTKRLSLTILLTACIGTTVWVVGDALFIKLGLTPPKAIQAIFGVYAVVAWASWWLPAKLPRSSDMSESNTRTPD
jgi:hypothetical protein